MKKSGNILQEEFDDFWNTNVLRDEILNENSKYIIAKNENGEILGFAGIFINVDFAEVMNIVVRKKFRNQGIGKKLLEKLISLCQEIGAESLKLEVNEKNKIAIKLYENIGFNIVGRRKKYYNNLDDAILMDMMLKKL